MVAIDPITQKNISKYWNMIPKIIQQFLQFLFILFMAAIIFLGIRHIAFNWVSIAMDAANISDINKEPQYYTLVGVYTDAILTLMLAFLAGLSAFYALHSNNQSNKKQRIKYLEKRLEKFYMPVLNALETSSCNIDEKNQIFSSCILYSYLASKEVHCLFIKYMNKRGRHPDNPYSNNVDCRLFDELLDKVKKDIEKNQGELRELIESY